MNLLIVISDSPPFLLHFLFRVYDYAAIYYKPRNAASSHTSDMYSKSVHPEINPELPADAVPDFRIQSSDHCIVSKTIATSGSFIRIHDASGYIVA